MNWTLIPARDPKAPRHYRAETDLGRYDLWHVHPYSARGHRKLKSRTWQIFAGPRSLACRYRLVDAKAFAEADYANRRARHDAIAARRAARAER